MANAFDLQIKSLSGSQIEILATDAVSLTGAEKVLIVQSGATKETTAQAIANLGGGSSYLVKTYAELVALINASGLVAGTQYEISDFATKHYIVDSAGTKPSGNPIITGATEPLIVTAVDVDKLDKIAKSTLYPQDIIYLDLVEANWTDDLSFSLAGVIVTGWKGTIYFRHDTLLDNYMGYDFRNCKFRRWKTSVSAWSAITTYSVDNFVSRSGFIYRSLTNSNLNNTPSVTSIYWVQLMDLSLTEYWNNNPTSTNGIPSDAASFTDIKTFSEGSGSATYELCCRSNHFESVKDDITHNEVSKTLLSNNVFFLQDLNIFQIYGNQIAVENYWNTVGRKFIFNSLGTGFAYNQIGGNFEGNSFGPGSSNNIIGTDFSFNTIGEGFNVSSIGANFNGNQILNYFSGNSVGQNFETNLIGNECANNKISKDCANNSIGSGFATNIIGDSFTNNTVGSSFTNNTVGSFFNVNDVKDTASVSINYSSATHVYNSYNTTIFKRVDGTAKLSYFNNSDVLTVANANA